MDYKKLRNELTQFMHKVGILGHSYGGTTALFHGALDERIKFICTSGALASFSPTLYI